jgi:hypothetical protein
VKSTLERLCLQNEENLTRRVPEVKEALSCNCTANSFCTAGDTGSTNGTSGTNDTSDVRGTGGTNNISDPRGINSAGSICVRKGPERIYYETGNASKFLEVGRMFLGGEIKEVVSVKLDMQQ